MKIGPFEIDKTGISMPRDWAFAVIMVLILLAGVFMVRCFNNLLNIFGAK